MSIRTKRKQIDSVPASITAAAVNHKSRSRQTEAKSKAEAEAEAEPDKRSYNSPQYWDDRYQFHLNQSSSVLTDSSALDSDITTEWYYNYSDIEFLLNSHIQRWISPNLNQYQSAIHH